MKINEILVEAATNQRVAGGVPPAVTNLKANQARTAAFNQSKLAAQQAGTAQPATAGTTQAQPATAGKLNPGKANSALGSFMRGAGATQGADAVDAYATAQQNTDDGYFDHGQWIKGPKPATRKEMGSAKGTNNPMYGRSAITEKNLKWYTNGIENKYITEGTQSDGFVRGRTNLSGNIGKRTNATARNTK